MTTDDLDVTDERHPETRRLVNAGLRVLLHNDGQQVQIRRRADNSHVGDWWPQRGAMMLHGDSRADHGHSFKSFVTQLLAELPKMNQAHQFRPPPTLFDTVPSPPEVTTLELVRLALAGGAWRLDMNIPAARLVAEMEALRDLLRRPPFLSPLPGATDELRQNPQLHPG